jgi:predicted nucleic acid-binding protein
VGLILDSCVWIGLATGELVQERIIAATGTIPVYTSVISLGELHFGVEVCTDPTERALRASFMRQVEERPVLALSRHTAAAFGVLAASVKRAGRSPRPRYNDLWIAAQAIEHGFGLVTVNGGDFTGLPGLRLIELG